MNGSLRVLNRQRTRPVNGRRLRRVVLEVLRDFPSLKEFDLTIHLLNARAMTKLNEEQLRHEGVTDVITFDYGESNSKESMAGSIFVCVDEAIAQSRRYRATWQSEVARYVIHGVLHLRGFDDRRVSARRRMKREEERLLNRLAKRFNLRDLERQ